MTPALPALLDLTGRLVLVVGAGPVGLRKLRAALDAGADARVVALTPVPPEAFGPGRVEWRTEPYRVAHLDGVAVVFAAGPPDVNRVVAADARARGLWVNSADPPGVGNFTLPAVTRRGPFTLAVSTGGAAPSLARRVRERLDGQFDEAFGQWVALLAEARELARSQLQDAARRRAVLEELSDWGWLDAVRREGVDAVRTRVLAMLAG